MHNAIKTDNQPTLVITDEIKATAADLLLQFGLNFNISKRPLSDEREPRTTSGFFGLFNDQLNKCLHTVKDGYRVTQTEEVMQLALVGAAAFGHKLSVTKAWVINEGRKVCVQLAIEGDSIVGNDIVKRFITIIDSNDGTCSLSVGIGDRTMSCQNMFYRFYKTGNKFRHTATMEQKLLELPALIESALAKSLTQLAVYQEMFQHVVTEKNVDELVFELLGFARNHTSMEDLAKKSTRSINKMEALYSAIYEEITDKGWNLWGLHSGTTRFTTFTNQAPKRENGREESQILGGGYKMNQTSLAYAYKLLGKTDKVSIDTIGE